MNAKTDDDSQLGKSRRTYGRGFLDGLRAAGVENPEDYMNNAKIQAAVLGQTGIARKVYNTVPTDESWSATKIISEMRAHGHNIEFSVLEGCLNTLKASKLIKENEHGYYRVVPKLVERAPVEKDGAGSAPSTPQAAPAAPQDPLSRIATISDVLRNLAHQLDDIALEVSDKSAASEKLQKVKDLLKDLA